MTTALPPDSHTGRRLEHSTSAHLHATTYRTFIGPIPEGWLKSHKKEWYRDYVSGGESKRKLSFRASSNQEAQQPRQTGASGASGPQEDGPRPSSQSRASQRVQAGVNTATSQTSQTSLLHEQRDTDVEQSLVRNENPEATSSQQDGDHLRLRPSDALRVDTLAHAATNIAKAVPRVRFNESTRYQLRARAQRLSVRGTFRSSKIKEGEVLKMDRMLVRIDVTRQTLGMDFDEKISAGVEAKTLDKWREFMVVCRKHAKEDADTVLQFYQTRVIAASSADVGKAKKKPKVELLLSSQRVRANLYSSLDKTLCVWTAGKGRTTIYYLQPQSGAASVEWYTFLRGVLGFRRTKTLQVNVPDLDVSLRLDDPFRSLEGSELLAEAARGDDDALAKAVDEEKGAAGAIVARCIRMLAESSEWADILKAWAQHGPIGLAWKRYDRLEWVHGAIEQRMYGTIAMIKTHDLELRPKHHYPLSTKTHKGKILEEPTPVEGFLIRLTSQKGAERRLGKMVYKRLYFMTQNQYLLFLRPGQAIPPSPPKPQASAKAPVPLNKQPASQVPLTYAVDPYPLDDQNRISWLDTEDVLPAAEQEGHDADAAAEADRNVKMLLGCDGFIDLCDVKHIRKMHRGAMAEDQNLDDGSEVDFEVSSNLRQQSSPRNDGDTSSIDDDRTFEILMSNGLIVRLQAFSKETKTEWMRCLRALVRYWKDRCREDIDLFKSVRQQNLDTLQIDEAAEALVGSFAYKWEVSQSYASPTLYNMCGIAQCRTIHLSGSLFRKPRRHATFTRCHVILSHGHLLIFQDVLRSRSGKRLVSIHHERIASIDLKGCYLYSGLLTENDLLYQNRTFDSNQPGHHALPRIYLEDGWTSTDEDAMTTFVIWHAKSKSWFRSSQFVDDVRLQEDTEERDRRKGRKTKLTRVSQLGSTGRSVAFKARSRAERDHWVMGIQVEIERLSAEGHAGFDDVRLVRSDKK